MIATFPISPKIRTQRVNKHKIWSLTEFIEKTILSLNNFPRPPKCHGRGKLLAVFLAFKIFICLLRRWLICPLQTPQSHAIQNSIFSKGVSKTGKFVFVVSFVNGASSAEACHGTAHNMYYILICTCGILICRILANEACDLQCLCHVAAKGTSSDIILHPPLQNTSNPVRCAGRQLSHGNLNFAAESSSCTPHFGLEKIY